MRASVRVCGFKMRRLLTRKDTENISSAPPHFSSTHFLLSNVKNI